MAEFGDKPDSGETLSLNVIESLRARFRFWKWPKRAMCRRIGAEHWWERTTATRCAGTDWISPLRRYQQICSGLPMSGRPLSTSSRWSPLGPAMQQPFHIWSPPSTRLSIWFWTGRSVFTTWVSVAFYNFYKKLRKLRKYIKLRLVMPNFFKKSS